MDFFCSYSLNGGIASAARVVVIVAVLVVDGLNSVGIVAPLASLVVVVAVVGDVVGCLISWRREPQRFNVVRLIHPKVKKGYTRARILLSGWRISGG